MAEYKGLSVVFEGDATSLSAALSTINARAQQAQGNLTALNKALKLDPSNTDLLIRKTANLETSLSSAKGRATQLSEATASLARKQKDAAAAVQTTSKGYNEAKENLAKVDAQLKANRQSLEALEEKLTDPSANNSFLTAEREKYDALSQSTAALENQRAVLGDVVSEHDRAKVAYEQASAALEKNLTDIATAKANYQQLEKELSLTNSRLYVSESSLGRFSSALATSGTSVANLGDNLVRASSELAIFSAMALSFGTGQLISQTEAFGNAISQVGGYLDITGSKLSALSDLALEVGYSTQFSATEAAQAMAELAKGGMTEAEIAAGGLNATMQLAAAGQMDLASAAETTVTSMRAFGLEAENAIEIADALAGAANGSTAEVSDLSTAFSQVSAVAYNAGWSIQDTAGAIALLSDRGLQGEMAGTALKVMMQRLQSPTQAAASVMEQYGIQVRDSNGQMKSATEITAELQSKLGTLGDAERDAALQTMFGTRASNAALILMQAGSDELERYISLASDSGAASEMAQRQMGQLGWAMEYLRGEAETAVVNLGNALTPTIVELAGSLEDLLGKFNSLTPAEQAFIGKTIALIAALPLLTASFGAVLSVGGRIASVLGTAGQAVSVFSGYTKSGSNAVTALGKALEFIGTDANGASNAVGKIGTAISKVGSSATTASGGINAAAIALKALKGVGAVAMFAALSAVVLDVAASMVKFSVETQGASEQSKKSIKNLDEATSNLRDTVKKTGDASYSFSDALEDTGEASSTSSASIDDMTASVNQLNESIKDNWVNYETEVQKLNDVQAVIDEYANKTGLTVSQQEKLKQAISTLNELCGTNYQVVDAANGKIAEQGSTAEVTAAQLDTLIQKQRELAKQEAIQQSLTDAWQAYYEALELANEKAQEHEEVLAQIEEKERKIAELQSEHFVGGDRFGGYDSSESQNEYERLNGELERLKSNERDAARESKEANEALSDEAETIDLLESQFDDTNKQTQEAIGTLREWVDTTNELNTSRWTDDLKDKFTENFTAMGLSLKDFQNLSQQTLNDISLNYDGSMSSLIEILSRHSDEFENEGIRAALSYYNGLSEGSKKDLEESGNLSFAVLQALQAASSQFGITGEQAAQYYLQGLESGALTGSSSAEEIANYIASATSNPEAYKSSGFASAQSFINGLSEGSVGALEAANALNSSVISALQSAASLYGLTGDEAVGYYIKGIQSGALNSSSTAADIAAYIASQVKNDGAAVKSGESLAKKLSQSAFSGIRSSADSEGPSAGLYLIDKVSEGMNPNGTFAEKAELGAQEYSYALGGNAVLTEGGVKLVDNAAAGAAPNGKFGVQGLAAVSEYIASLLSGNTSAGSYGSAMRDAALSGTYPNGLFAGSGQQAGAEYSGGIAGESGSATSAGSVVAAAAEAAMKGSNLFKLAGIFAGTSYSSGISSMSSIASMAGSTLANAARSTLSAASSYAYSSGRNLGLNYASGIRSAYGNVASAANALASAAAAYLHHSTPDKGPLKDDDVWGLHMAQNIAKSMLEGTKYVEQASSKLASAVVEPVASWGPIEPSTNRYASSASMTGAIASAMQRVVDAYENNPTKGGTYIENQNFSTKVVRADEDMYTVAPIIFRNATREARLMSK